MKTRNGLIWPGAALLALSVLCLKVTALAAEEQNPLSQDVWDDNVASLEARLRNPANLRFLNQEDEDHRNILYQTGSYRTFKLLVDRGARIRTTDTELIHHIIDTWAQSYQGMLDSEKAVEFLLAKGVDPRPPLFERQVTVLHTSMSMNSAKITEMLLKRGADPNARDVDGNTPLHYTSINFDFETPFVARKIELLLAAGGGIDARNNIGTTPLMAATHEVVGQTAIELVKHGANVNLQDEDGYTALHWACWQHNDLNMIRFLLNHGADLALKNSEGQTARDMLSQNTLLEEDQKSALKSEMDQRRNRAKK